jgi:DHA2 family multidrug resistance protein-like MFS transporter
MSAALSLAAVLAVIWGIKRMAELGLQWLPAGTIAAGLALGVLFLRRQRKLADPLIDVGLISRPAFAAALAINVLTIFMAFGAFLFMAQYLQLVLGMGPLEAGLWTAPSGIVFVVGSLLTPMIARRLRPSNVIACGLLIAALGFVVLTQLHAEDGLVVLMAGMLILCAGLAPVGTLTTDLVVGLAPPEQAGAASAISETSFELGGALGIAVLGSIMAAIYRGLMADAVLAAGVLGPIEAKETIGGAVAAAERLQGEAGARLLAAAREAYTSAFAATAFISVVIALLAVALAVTFLKSADPDSGGEGRRGAQNELGDEHGREGAEAQVSSNPAAWA